MKKSQIIAFRYLTKKAGKESYEMLRMADVNNNEDDGVVHAVGVGFTNIDEVYGDDL